MLNENTISCNTTSNWRRRSNVQLQCNLLPFYCFQLFSSSNFIAGYTDQHKLLSLHLYKRMFFYEAHHTHKFIEYTLLTWKFKWFQIWKEAKKGWKRFQVFFSFQSNTCCIVQIDIYFGLYDTSNDKTVRDVMSRFPDEMLSLWKLLMLHVIH